MALSSSFLENAKHFSVSAEVWQDLEDANGHWHQFSKRVDVKVNRPSNLRVDIFRGAPKRSFFYDGKSLAVLDHVAGFYAQVNAPDTIDSMLSKVEEKFDITLPLEDLVQSKPFGGGAKKALSAQYLGIDNILGVQCHHVAFQNDVLD